MITKAPIKMITKILPLVGAFLLYIIPVSSQEFSDLFQHMFKNIEQETTYNSSIPTGKSKAIINTKQIIASAETALKNNRLSEAENLYKQVAAGGEKTIGLYGLALTLSQKGKYNIAEKIMAALAHGNDKIAKAAKEYRGHLLLNIAEDYLYTDNLNKSKTWLNKFQLIAENHPAQQRFTELKYKVFNNINLLTENNNWQTKPLRISLLLPLSGDNAEVSRDLLRATELAMFKHTTEKILIYPYDTKGTPDGARQAVQTAINDGSDIFLGPLLASSVDAAAPFARSANIPMIAFSSDTAVANRNTFLLSYQPAGQAKVMANWATATSITTIAAMVPQNYYGEEMFRVFTKHLPKAVSITSKAYFNPNLNDFTVPLEQLVKLDESKKAWASELKVLENEYRILGGAMDDVSLTRLTQLQEEKPAPIINFDALYIPTSGEIMPLLASQLAFYDIDSKKVKIIGSSMWKSKNLLQNRAEYLRGAIFPAPSHTGSQAFTKMFVETFGSKPNPISILAYDGIAITVDILTSLKNGYFSTIKDALTKTEGFYSLGGTFRFDEYGRCERLYDIIEVASRSLKILEKAPKTMPPLLPHNLNPNQNMFIFNPWVN